MHMHSLKLIGNGGQFEPLTISNVRNLISHAVESTVIIVVGLQDVSAQPFLVFCYPPDSSCLDGPENLGACLSIGSRLVYFTAPNPVTSTNVSLIGNVQEIDHTNLPCVHVATKPVVFLRFYLHIARHGTHVYVHTQ